MKSEVLVWMETNQCSDGNVLMSHEMLMREVCYMMLLDDMQGDCEPKERDEMRMTKEKATEIVSHGYRACRLF